MSKKSQKQRIPRLKNKKCRYNQVSASFLTPLTKFLSIFPIHTTSYFPK